MSNDVLRSECPINFALEMLGDKWSLLIVRDIMMTGKHSYSEFLHSDEGIATNILSKRLSALEADGIITKERDPANHKKYIYNLTPRGMRLVPLIIDIIIWTDSIAPIRGERALIVARIKNDRQGLIDELLAHLESGNPESFEHLLLKTD